MDIEQLIFKKLFDFFKAKKEINHEVVERTIPLVDIHSRMSLIARALTGESIEVIASEREGGWKDQFFYFPKEMSLFPETEMNFNYYLFRLFYLTIQKKEALNWKHDEVFDTIHSQQKAIESSAYILQKLFEEYPGLETVHQTLLENFPQEENEKKETFQDFSWLYGRFMKNSIAYEQKKQLEKHSLESIQKSHGEITTEIEAKGADELEVLQVDKEQQQQYVMTHNFEKVDTIDEHTGSWRDFDGDDDLSDDQEALEEHNLKHVVRVDDPVHSVYKAQFSGNANIAESSALEKEDYHLSYPEWNFSKREYKQDYCQVYPKRILKNHDFYYTETIKNHQATLLKLKKMFAMLTNTLEVSRRQPDGDNIDLDALTDFYADLAAKRTPNERVYLHRRKTRKDITLLFLLDLSLSSDGYAKGNRIIDVEKQVSILFGEVLNEYGISFQIDAFYSKTRNNTTYISLKTFDDSWDTAKHKIGSIQPQGYTRIGPAIRHAHSLLKKQSSKKKWLILLSDGKPNDYDKYEGKYGIQDVKQALRETKADGIENFALAIEEQAKYYLPQMFGKNHYNILSSPMEMIVSLTKLYKRIAQG